MNIDKHRNGLIKELKKYNTKNINNEESFYKELIKMYKNEPSNIEYTISVYGDYTNGDDYVILYSSRIDHLNKKQHFILWGEWEYNTNNEFDYLIEELYELIDNNI